MSVCFERRVLTSSPKHNRSFPTTCLTQRLRSLMCPVRLNVCCVFVLKTSLFHRRRRTRVESQCPKVDVGVLLLIRRRAQLRAAVAALPLERYAVLRYLIEFLTDVHAFAHVNQMTSSNLSIIFGPGTLAFEVGGELLTSASDAVLLHPREAQQSSLNYLNAIPKSVIVLCFEDVCLSFLMRT